MGSELGLLILIFLLVIAILIGVPIGFSLFFASIVVVMIDPDLHMLIVPIIAIEKLYSFTLLAIPLFMYAATLLNEFEFTEDVVEISRILVGRFRSGLAQINVVASMFFAGVSGSSAADTAGVGGILIPAMIKKGYSKSFSATITAASSTIGNIIPPSIMMVVYGATAEISVGALFMAGIIPGILVGLSQMGTAYIYGRIYHWEGKSDVAVEPTPFLTNVKTLLFRGFFPLSIFILIIGGIMGGIFTATEAAAVTAIYIAVVGPLLYNKARSLSAFIRAARKAAVLSAVTYFAIIGSSIFAYLLSFYMAIDLSVTIFSLFEMNQVTFLIVLSLLFVVLGTFIDPIPIIIIMTPLVIPLSDELQIHPLLLGIVSIMAIRIGTVTPPYGISMLIAAGIAKIDPVKMLRDVSIFTGIFMLIVLLIILFPQLCLIIPQWII